MHWKEKYQEKHTRKFNSERLSVGYIIFFFCIEEKMKIYEETLKTLYNSKF